MKHYNLYARLNGDWRQYAIDYEGELLGQHEAPIAYDGGIDEAMETVRRQTVPGLLEDPSIDAVEIMIAIEEAEDEDAREIKETVIELGFQRAEPEAVQTFRREMVRRYALED